MLNFKSLTGGVAAAALVSTLGLAYAQTTTTTTEQAAGSTTSNTEMRNQANQPSTGDRSTMTGTSQSRDNTPSSMMPSDSRSGDTLDRNFDRAPRADRN